MRIYGLFNGKELVGSPVFAADDAGFENQIISIFIAAPIEFYKALSARCLGSVAGDGVVTPIELLPDDVQYHAEVYDIIRAAVVRFEEGMNKDA